MNRKYFSNMLKLITICTAVCGIVIFFILVPIYADQFAKQYPELSLGCSVWIIFLIIFSLPCFVSLIFGWKIAVNIGLDNSFSYDNADSLKVISVLAAADSAFFFIGNIVFLVLNISHPTIMLFSIFATFAGIAVCTVCSALSHLVQKAAEIKAENDLTI